MIMSHSATATISSMQILKIIVYPISQSPHLATPLQLSLPQLLAKFISIGIKLSDIPGRQEQAK